MTRRTELLDDLKAIRELGRTPRIDTVHNRISSAIRLLTTTQEELGDLHVLAYERHTARRELVVAGGERDYALDNHGDPQARTAYRQLALAAIDAIEILTDAADDTLRILRNGNPDRPRTRRTINLEELAGALEAQARREASGAFTPVRREAQPEADNVMAKLRKDRDQARAEADGLHKLVGRLMKRLERQDQRESA